MRFYKCEQCVKKNFTKIIQFSKLDVRLVGFTDPAYT